MSVVLHPCDLSSEIVEIQSSRIATARRGRPLRRCSVLSTRPKVSESDIASESLQSTPFFHGESPVTLDQQAVELLLMELCRSNTARPLLRCGAGRPNHSVLTEQNSSDSSDDSYIDRLNNSACRRSLTLRPRRRRRGEGVNSEPIREQLLAWDLSSLQDLVIHGQLPGGPEAAVRQLRLVHVDQTLRIILFCFRTHEELTIDDLLFFGWSMVSTS